MLRPVLFLAFLFLPFLTAADTKQEGIDFLTKNAKQRNIISLPSGLQYKVLKKGNGKHYPAPHSPCFCDFEGRLISGRVIDSSKMYKEVDPVGFAPNDVINGLSEAMQMMVEGDKWELYIPSNLAYGEADDVAGPDIPGGTVLIYVIELLEIKGEKVSVLACNVVSGQGCDEKDLKYINMTRIKPIANQREELDRLNDMIEEKMAADLLVWIKRRIYLLTLMTNLAEQTVDTQEL